METLIQTSIVRDELITARSLDLPEQGRFKAVRYALGRPLARITQCELVRYSPLPKY